MALFGIMAELVPRAKAASPLGDELLHFIHYGTEITAPDVDIHPAQQARVLAPEHRRAVVDPEGCHIVQPYLGAAPDQYRQIAQFLDRIAQLARV